MDTIHMLLEVVSVEDAMKYVKTVDLPEDVRQAIATALGQIRDDTRLVVRPRSEQEAASLKAGIRKLARGMMRPVRFDDAVRRSSKRTRTNFDFVVRLATDAELDRDHERGQNLTAARARKR